MLRAMHLRLGGKITLVGVGGITTGDDAYEKILAGATLVQLYTALALSGPSLIKRIKQELLSNLRRDGIRSIAHAVGRDAILKK
jgi:dihydroorotate dehydrogenase